MLADVKNEACKADAPPAKTGGASALLHIILLMNAEQYTIAYINNYYMKALVKIMIIIHISEINIIVHAD